MGGGTGEAVVNDERIEKFKEKGVHMVVDGAPFLVVGVLLVSALMIVPVAAAELVSSSFRRTMTVAMAIGVTVCVAGLTITYFHDASPGATIVVLAIGVYALAAVARPFVARARARRLPAWRDPHPDMPDDVELAGVAR